jgi:hypothetical protein
MKIRKALEEDVQGILNVMHSRKINEEDTRLSKKGYLVYGLDEKELKEVISNPRAKLYVAEDSSGIQGYMLAYDLKEWEKIKPGWRESIKSSKKGGAEISPDKTLYVRHIAVLENSPRETAIKLGNTLYKEAREEGYESSVGEIRRAPIRNEKSERYHKALGYKRIGHMKYDNMIWGVFKKDLNKKSSLEEKVSVAATIIGIGTGLFFLSSNITGKVIADLSSNTSSWIGILFLVISLLAGFFWINKKKRRR